jgi:hypothetical protein
MKVVMLSALRTGHLYHTGIIPDTHFCAAGKVMLMKTSNDTIGNRSSDLPVFSAVPQPR